MLSSKSNEIYLKWKNRKLAAIKTMELLKLKGNTFYKLVKQYEDKKSKLENNLG